MKFFFHKLFFLFMLINFFSCGSDSSSGSNDSSRKIKLKENLTYKVFLDESYLKNPQVNTVFEKIDETYTSTLNATIEIILLNSSEFKLTGDMETFSGMFSNTTSFISDMATAAKLGFKSGSTEVKKQISILSELEDTFNEKVSDKINSDLKKLVTNLYPLEYLITKNEIHYSDSSDKTIKLFKSNKKINNYLIEDIVPTFFDVVESFTKLNRVVVLNKLNKNQVDSLKLQILSFDNDFGQFQNKGSIKNFKDNYLKFSNLKNLKNSNISSEIQFLNEEMLVEINKYIDLQDSKIKKLISFLGANDLVDVQKVLIGDYPIFTVKKYETYQSKIRDTKFNKLLQELKK